MFARVDKPTAERFSGKRKLFLVPLMYQPSPLPEEGQTLLKRYWRQAQSQIANLEISLGQIQHVYHESVTLGGSDGLEQVQSGFTQSYTLVHEAYQNGATLQCTEDEDTLLQVIDIQHLLMLPLASESVASRLNEWFQESNHQRYARIAARIEETLQPNEVGLLIINERHQVQFPTDLEVIYVSPPALDEYRRWLQAYVVEQQRQAAEAMQQAQTTEGEAGTNA